MSYKLKSTAAKADIDIRLGIAPITLPTAASGKNPRQAIYPLPWMAYGRPTALISDNGATFISQRVREPLPQGPVGIEIAPPKATNPG
ncbi:hypothetical protein HFO02_34080 [Rhizobium laguerreae]|uniref:hypothetical protein n=1 Tax=Rhizobium laguerreae TaxID=1076926 RepID=UPI001C92ABFF|nr:hypothetical protein [Rhizobium laguerreae]MBY3328530.1 hypothetical protein [Rhizobium laguerreae]